MIARTRDCLASTLSPVAVEFDPRDAALRPALVFLIRLALAIVAPILQPGGAANHTNPAPLNKCTGRIRFAIRVRQAGFASMLVTLRVFPSFKRVHNDPPGMKTTYAQNRPNARPILFAIEHRSCTHPCECTGPPFAIVSLPLSAQLGSGHA